MRPEQYLPSVESEEPAPPAAAGRLMSTGIPALDARLGGIVRGRHYLLDGAPGAGKSSAALHFVGSGLAAGERCLLLTQDDPADVLAQSEFLGYDFRAAAERDQLWVLQFRLDFARNFARSAEPARVFAELRRYVEACQPERFAVDSISPLLEGGAVTEEAISLFPEFLDSLRCTTYLTAPGDLNEAHFTRLYDRVIAGAAGIFHFATVDGQVRELSIRKLRQPVISADPLRFVLRPGIGIVEHTAGRRDAALPEAVRRRVVVVGEAIDQVLPEEVGATLADKFEVVRYPSVEQAYTELVGARYGTLLLGVEPRNAERAFQLVRELRRSGNGAPVLFVSPHQGLRGSTRARGLRGGGDDFLTDVLSPEEIVERIEAACARGHRRGGEEVELHPVVVQPSTPDGRTPLLEADAFREILRDKLARVVHPFFALILVTPDTDADHAWELFCRSLRVTEGDLGARLPDGRIALYLHDVRRRDIEPLLRRVVVLNPELGLVETMQVLTVPADRGEVEAWLAAGDGTPR